VDHRAGRCSVDPEQAEPWAARRVRRLHHVSGEEAKEL
jgi:hypothetical protein